MRSRTSLVAVLVFVALFASSCSGSDAPSDPPTTGDSTSAPATATEDCDLLTPSGDELWPGLDADAPELADDVRLLTADLTLNNRYSCRAMVVVDPLVSAQDVGALASSSLEHQDPYVRFDLFTHDPDLPSSTIATGLEDQLPGDSAVQVSSPRPYLTMIVSWTDDGSTAMPRDGSSDAPEELKETFRIINYYSDPVFGSE